MPIKIVSSDEPIRSETLSCVILGNPGTWKTSMANTAEKPLLLAFDLKGARRSLNRPNTVLIEKWADIAGLTAEDIAPYKTIIIDTIGRALDVMANAIMEENPKMSNGGQLSLQGFGRLKSQFRLWLARMNGYGVSVVMVAHGIETKQGDEIRLRIDGQGSSPEFVYQEADMMGRTQIRGGRSYIDWNPSESGFGKNPAGLPAEAIPDIKQNPDYLAKAIARTIDHLNQASEESTLEERRLAGVREAIEKLQSPADFTDAAQSMKQQGAANADRAILVGAAQKLGYVLDKKTLTFSDPNAPEEINEGEF